MCINCGVLLQWLEKDFLKYLQDWEDEANGCNPDNPSEVNKMMLSRETLEGIKITGGSKVITYWPSVKWNLSNLIWKPRTLVPNNTKTSYEGILMQCSPQAVFIIGRYPFAILSVMSEDPGSILCRATFFSPPLFFPSLSLSPGMSSVPGRGHFFSYKLFFSSLLFPLFFYPTLISSSPFPPAFLPFFFLLNFSRYFYSSSFFFFLYFFFFLSFFFPFLLLFCSLFPLFIILLIASSFSPPLSFPCLCCFSSRPSIIFPFPIYFTSLPRGLL